MSGKLFVVGTPIGNLGDFSPRGVETLESADYIAAEDTRVTLKLLTHFGIKKPLLSCYKPKEREKSERIISLLLEGNNIAMVSDAGMPCISDPGSLLVAECYERGIPVEIIPGCNAAVAAVAASGLEIDRWAFEGFLPVPKKERAARLEEVKTLPHALVYYEAPHKIRQTLIDLESALGGERRAALCRELTKLHEEVLRGTLAELAHYYDDTEPRGEYVIVVKGAEKPESEYTLEQAAELAKTLVNGGEKLSEACRQAAKATGVSKREIYSALSNE
ncbi:MAG: 16S rRNA (cytidine(1402)-2'-O)-methyltransferase [Lachnospiraceae bacterium]|nr:16S rRNA (cytidine(1402)-2'-O)-methyltransferase [Ruminococcus sp.]MCM1275997.1 16S rRNA (cytidine(1402)-2'-O)-methyltransferase [Lachnospiraceae bacterium]